MKVEITIQIDSDLLERVDELANERGQSRSEIIEQALGEYLEKLKRTEKLNK